VSLAGWQLVDGETAFFFFFILSSNASGHQVGRVVGLKMGKLEQAFFVPEMEWLATETSPCRAEGSGVDGARKEY
jgi:hypothetical protein